MINVNGPTRLLALVIAGGSIVTLSGCSINTLIWGSDGARVIDLTEQLIDAAPSGTQDSLACEDLAADFGGSEMWDGLSAGEPEQVGRAGSVDGSSPDATWRINLEGVGINGTSGENFPTDVFYREAATGLCVADIVWQPVDLGSRR